MTESLFDTNFSEPTEKDQSASTTESTTTESAPAAAATSTSTTEESSDVKESSNDESNQTHDESSGEISTTTLPSLHDKSKASTLINFRVLVSAKESGCLIGQNGKVIDSIRAETNTKAGISRLLPGSHERILTVSGTLDDCSKALSFFAQALCDSTIENYNYFPLKQLSSTPCIEHESTILRLLIPNSQMGTLIGSKGLRIQQIQSNYNISMIASKSFLPGSNERLVELQGTVNNLYDSLRIISRCLIEDFSSMTGTNYYIPRGHSNTSSGSNYSSNGGSNNGNGTSNRHSNGSTSLSSSTSNNSNNNNNNNSNSTHNSNNNNNNNNNGKRPHLTTTSISFPNDIVGALIGKNGSRIQGVRKVSGATIGISEEVEGKGERIFTIAGTSHAVEKAKELLYHNLEREEQRRNETGEK
ncbi:hypothetical protein DFJ63DRAFT_330253 [Scheffersomyces coipomensis]|uniref:uncharacterized protein n=1 Tax=Scheffersomyces coipomensis TaxID=1788519 RepID=UPI00315DBA2C